MEYEEVDRAYIGKDRKDAERALAIVAKACRNHGAGKLAKIEGSARTGWSVVIYQPKRK